MANGAGTPAATPNPFGPQQQPSTPMGGGASPLNTGGGMSGQNQMVGTMGGFGGNLGTAGTLGGQQNSPALTMMPQNQGPYTAPISQPISAEAALNNSPNMSPAVLGNMGNMGSFFQQQQMGQQPQQQMQPQPSGNVGQFMQQNQQPANTPNPGYQGGQTPSVPAGQDPTLIFNPFRPQQPDMSTAIGQLKGGDQFAAQNTMRQLVGLSPLQAPAYSANPTMSDVQQLLQSGDKASAQSMMQRMVGLPASSPAPAITAPPQQQPMGIQRLMQASPIRRPFGRGRR